ncbi:MAG: hypothetical protein AB7T17_01475 [Geobacter sp.]|jgi:hypothetical protein|uniref:hypothetical protein n=1 Tax=Trichlorobacter sp. TaxID=2911007 RepID=UPI002A365FD5|nr:hypothetical protein [Trichlorobacter sp.]MDY0383627.1 hypothetical protein [Trichlorobacter sp.]
MESHTLDEAARILTPSADYLQKTLEQLRNKILFSGKAHPILKPCVFFPEPISLRIFNRYGIINKCEVDYKRKTVPVPCSDGRTRDCSYDSANIPGLFQLTLFPESFDTTESKESGRIQLFREKAVFADCLANFSIDMAVGWIMNGWQHFNELKNKWEPETPPEVKRTKSHVRGKIGECVILTQNGVHYLVDSPVSIPLSDIRITDKMLTEYAASEGIKLPPKMTPVPTIDQAAKQVTVDFDIQDYLPVRFLDFYTGGKLGPETTALCFAHKQGIDWNRRMETEDKLTAYHWQYGKTTAIKRTEWESVLHSIKSLSERYNKTERHFDEWRTAALKLLPVAFVRRSEFDAAYQRAMSPERITFLDQSRGFERLTGDEDKEARQTTDTPYIPTELLDIVFEGFNVSPATFHSSPEQTAQKATQSVKEKKEATTTDNSKKMSALKKGKIKANSKAVDKLLAAYHGDTGKKASDHNDLLRHMREHPTLYPLAGFGKDGDVDRYFWLKVSSGAAKEHFSKKQIVRKIVARLKNNEYLTKESLVEKNM